MARRGGLYVSRRTREIEHGEAALWPLLGPLLVCSDVHRDLGVAPTSAPGVRWFVVVERNGDVCGFAAAKRKPGRIEMCHHWVAPRWRGFRIGSHLIDARVRWWLDGTSETRAETVVVRDLAPSYLRRGFAVVREHQRYIHLRANREDFA